MFFNPCREKATTLLDEHKSCRSATGCIIAMFKTQMYLKNIIFNQNPGFANINGRPPGLTHD